MILCGCAQRRTVDTDKLALQSKITLQDVTSASYAVREAQLSGAELERALDRIAVLRTTVLGIDLIMTEVAGRTISAEDAEKIEVLVFTVYRHVASIASLPPESLAADPEEKTANRQELDRELDKLLDDLRRAAR
ncbi:MAG: hypothetical protein AAGB48_06650 [Planctomycetota bacterium]